MTAMGDMLTASNETFDILGIGPMTNFPQLLDNYPSIVQKTSIKVMGGSIYKGYDNSSTPVPEYNVKFCPRCVNRVISAGWSVYLSPVDTCGVADLPGMPYLHALKSLKLSTLILFETQRFIASKENMVVQGNRSLVWYDTVGTYLTVLNKTSSFVNIVNLTLHVTNNGSTVIDKVSGHLVHVALTWKDNGLDAFRNWVAQILYTNNPQAGANSLLQGNFDIICGAIVFMVSCLLF